MRKLIIGMFSVLIFAGYSSSYAQRHFYHRLDVGSSNIYTFALSNIVTGYTNYLTHDILFDNSYVYTLYGGKTQGEKIRTSPYSPIGITARDLFNDCFAGAKIGYQSDFAGFFNWGIYASAHYRINQIKSDVYDHIDKQCERFQYVKPGAGILFTFGGLENPVKVQCEAALRYDLPIGYSGLLGNSCNEVLQKGISTHFAIKVGGYSSFSAGLYADICHYDLYKNLPSGSHFKPYSFGITLTITPKRGEDLYD